MMRLIPAAALLCCLPGALAAAPAFPIVDVIDSTTINPTTGQPFGAMDDTDAATDGEHVVFAIGNSVWTANLDTGRLALLAQDGTTIVPQTHNTFVNVNLAGPPRLDRGQVVFTGQDSGGSNEYGFYTSDPLGRVIQAVYAPPPAGNPIATGAGVSFWVQGGIIAFQGAPGASSGGTWKIGRGGTPVVWLARDNIDECSGATTGSSPISLWGTPYTDGVELLEVGANAAGFELVQGAPLAHFEVAPPGPPTPGPCTTAFYDSPTLPSQPHKGGYAPVFQNLLGGSGDVLVLGVVTNGNGMPGNGTGANTYASVVRINGGTLTPRIILDNAKPLPLPGFLNADGSAVAPFHLGIQSFSMRGGRLVLAVNNDANWGTGGPPGGLVSALYTFHAGQFARIVGTGDTLANGFVVGGRVGLRPYAMSVDRTIAFWLQSAANGGADSGTFVTQIP